MDKPDYYLPELDMLQGTPAANDLFLVHDVSEGIDKKVPASELIGTDVAAAVNAWLVAHPEATTTVQDGSVTEAKLYSALADKINRPLFIDNNGLFYALVEESN